MLSDSPVSAWVSESTWTYYGMLAVHAVGMAAVVGGTFMLCLRVLGFGQGMPVADLERLRLVAWGGFFANAISGAILFCSNGPRLVANNMFQIKIASIILGGVALWGLWRAIGPNRLEPVFVFGGQAKSIAIGTLFFWTVAIVTGRYIAYTINFG